MSWPSNGEEKAIDWTHRLREYLSWLVPWLEVETWRVGSVGLRRMKLNSHKSQHFVTLRHLLAQFVDDVALKQDLPMYPCQGSMVA